MTLYLVKVKIKIDHHTQARVTSVYRTLTQTCSVITFKSSAQSRVYLLDVQCASGEDPGTLALCVPLARERSQVRLDLVSHSQLLVAASVRGRKAAGILIYLEKALGYSY